MTRTSYILLLAVLVGSAIGSCVINPQPEPPGASDDGNKGTGPSCSCDDECGNCCGDCEYCGEPDRDICDAGMCDEPADNADDAATDCGSPGNCNDCDGSSECNHDADTDLPIDNADVWTDGAPDDDADPICDGDCDAADNTDATTFPPLPAP
ncbi:MAG: hypothetical protein FWD57_13925 [Polyangiaceae bacterium]|nr:hypothetical protein [Polyangiaceae bacterium]